MPDYLNAKMEWQQGLQFVAETGSGHTLVVDGSPEFGGQDEGPRPVELLLVANATCMGMDVISTLQKMRQNVTSYRLRVRGERRDEYPRVFTHIIIEHCIHGEVASDKLRRAIELSEEKYCSVSAMLEKVATIETRYCINEEF